MTLCQDALALLPPPGVPAAGPAGCGRHARRGSRCVRCRRARPTGRSGHLGATTLAYPRMGRRHRPPADRRTSGELHLGGGRRMLVTTGQAVGVVHADDVRTRHQWGRCVDRHIVGDAVRNRGVPVTRTRDTIGVGTDGHDAPAAPRRRPGQVHPVDLHRRAGGLRAVQGDGRGCCGRRALHRRRRGRRGLGAAAGRQEDPRTQQRDPGPAPTGARAWTY